MKALLPAMVVGCVLMGIRAKVSVYDALIRGAKEGLTTLVQMAPCLCAVMMAVALLRVWPTTSGTLVPSEPSDR